MSARAGQGLANAAHGVLPFLPFHGAPQQRAPQKAYHPRTGFSSTFNSPAFHRIDIAAARSPLLADRAPSSVEDHSCGRVVNQTLPSLMPS